MAQYPEIYNGTIMINSREDRTDAVEALRRAKWKPFGKESFPRTSTGAYSQNENEIRAWEYRNRGYQYVARERGAIRDGGNVEARYLVNGTREEWDRLFAAMTDLRRERGSHFDVYADDLPMR